MWLSGDCFCLGFCQNCYRLVGLHKVLRDLFILFFVVFFHSVALQNAVTSLFFFYAHEDVHVWTAATVLIFGKQWAALENKPISLLLLSLNPCVKYAHDVLSVFSNQWHVYLHRHQTESLSPLAPLISEWVCLQQNTQLWKSALVPQPVETIWKLV